MKQIFWYLLIAIITCLVIGSIFYFKAQKTKLADYPKEVENVDYFKIEMMTSGDKLLVRIGKNDPVSLDTNESELFNRLTQPDFGITVKSEPEIAKTLTEKIKIASDDKIFIQALPNDEYKMDIRRQ